MASYSSRPALIHYDIEYDKSEVVQAHFDDINTLCLANPECSNILLSGGDDGIIFIWDRRALGINNKSVGMFLGHHSGITHITSKQDQFYFASNSKDNQVKLWDIRHKLDLQQ